jgi:hypothetical protein
MPTGAKLYISSAIIVGLAMLAGCLLYGWNFPDLPRYFGYLLLACLSSTLKIKLPKICGTMSINFLFVLIGVAELTVAETITLGCASALAQCLWKPRKRPTLVQILFNMSTLATSIGGCFFISHALVQRENLLGLLAVAVCTYFLLNTGMVSLVLALIEKRPYIKIWRQCYLWSFPYYLVGSGVAAAIIFSGRTAGWRPPLLMLPVMYLIYSYYRLYLLDHTENDYETAQ